MQRGFDFKSKSHLIACPMRAVRIRTTNHPGSRNLGTSLCAGGIQPPEFQILGCGAAVHHEHPDHGVTPKSIRGQQCTNRRCLTLAHGRCCVIIVVLFILCYYRIAMLLLLLYVCVFVFFQVHERRIPASRVSKRSVREPFADRHS